MSRIAGSAKCRACALMCTVREPLGIRSSVRCTAGRCVVCGITWLRARSSTEGGGVRVRSRGRREPRRARCRRRNTGTGRSALVGPRRPRRLLLPALPCEATEQRSPPPGRRRRGTQVRVQRVAARTSAPHPSAVASLMKRTGRVTQRVRRPVAAGPSPNPRWRHRQPSPAEPDARSPRSNAIAPEPAPPRSAHRGWPTGRPRDQHARPRAAPAPRAKDHQPPWPFVNGTRVSDAVDRPKIPSLCGVSPKCLIENAVGCCG